MLEAKLIYSQVNKSWALHFTGLEGPKDLESNPTKSSIWYWCRHYGSHWNTAPFLQGNSSDWVMVEFWCSSETLVLECVELIIKQLREVLEVEIPFNIV